MSTWKDISSEGSSGSSPPVRVLAVDDDAAVRMALQRLLERAGYIVTLACDASEALRFLSRSHFDLIISDLRMPGQSGIDLLEAVHQSEPDLPFLLISAEGGPGLEERARRLGAFAFLEKPIPRQALLDCASRALER